MVKWEERRLGECIRLISGGTPSKQASQYWGGDVPWVSPKDLVGPRIWDTQDHLSEAGANASIFVPPETILIPVRGMGLAKAFPVAVTKRTMSFNQDIKAVVPERFIDSGFLFYWFSAHSYEMMGIADEAAHGTKRIQTDRLLTFPISIPRLETQRKIADVLSVYDDLIENNLRRISILEEVGRTIFTESFVRFRHPGRIAINLVDSPVGRIPDDWRVLPLDAVCVRITDGSHWSPKAVEDGIPMASVKDMHEWGFHVRQCKRISREDYQELVRNDCKPLEGDIVIAKDGSYLKHTFLVEDELELAVLSSIAILRPNAVVHSYWLTAYLRSPEALARLKGLVSGVAVPRIVLKDFRKFQVPVPPENLQASFENVFAPLARMCWGLAEMNSMLQEARDLILPKLVSGELDVTNLDMKLEDDGSASA